MQAARWGHKPRCRARQQAKGAAWGHFLGEGCRSTRKHGSSRSGLSSFFSRFPTGCRFFKSCSGHSEPWQASSSGWAMELPPWSFSVALIAAFPPFGEARAFSPRMRHGPAGNAAIAGMITCGWSLLRSDSFSTGKMKMPPRRHFHTLSASRALTALAADAPALPARAPACVRGFSPCRIGLRILFPGYLQGFRRCRLPARRCHVSFPG